MNRTLLRCSGLLAGMALAAGAALAQDAGRGRVLYETYCQACHYERIHKREPSQSLVQSLQDLRAEVIFRSRFTAQTYTRQDIEDIVEYLNRSHYRLKK
jgi:mono/diheme cytochrome c family protein